MTERKSTPEEVETERAAGKVSLAEAAKQMLAQKKQAQADMKNQPKSYRDENRMMKSQHTKKINNQRKRMGV